MCMQSMLSLNIGKSVPCLSLMFATSSAESSVVQAWTLTGHLATHPGRGSLLTWREGMAPQWTLWTVQSQISSGGLGT